MRKVSLCLAVVSTLALSACSDVDDTTPPTETSVDTELQSKISSLGLTGDPTTGRTLPSINDPKAQLGMKLFFTKDLGGEQDSACVTCHHPSLGGGDDLSLPIGVHAEVADLLGPGRRHSSASAMHFDGGPTVPRNAPTTFNVALWDSVLFHDGRVESLDKTAGVNGAGDIRTPDSAFATADPLAGQNLAVAQARFPVTSPEEMRADEYVNDGDNHALRAGLESRLNGSDTGTNGMDLPINNWASEFEAAYGDTNPISYERIAEAIAEYERSQVFVDNPWKAYVEGDDNAISEAAKEGALLFFTSVANDGAGCSDCHSGDFFTDEGFHVIAMPQIGRGKGNGPDGTDDFGRFRETADAADMYAFRTPSLLNVEVYGPWGHAGGYTSLEAVVKHHSNPQMAIDNYDFNQLEGSVQATNMTANTQLAMDQLAANRTAGTITPILQDSNLTDEQVSQIVMFLKSLTDPCVTDRSCLADWVPNAGDSNPDGLRVIAVDNNGNDL